MELRVLFIFLAGTLNFKSGITHYTTFTRWVKMDVRQGNPWNPIKWQSHFMLQEKKYASYRT